MGAMSERPGWRYPPASGLPLVFTAFCVSVQFIPVAVAAPLTVFAFFMALFCE